MKLSNYLLIMIALFFVSCSYKSTVNDSIINTTKTANFNINLDDWNLQTSKSLNAEGSQISMADFDVNNWYSAKVPETVLHSLVQNGVYKDIYLDSTLTEISSEQFDIPWWYRTEFTIKNKTEGLLLNIYGINYKANIWLNGQLIADTSEVNNTFRQFKFDINKYTKTGVNTIAIEVIPPGKGDFSIGFVDWNPVPPDNNMGLFREVSIESNNGIGISDPFIETALNENHLKATLQASFVATNYTNKVQSGVVEIAINNKIIKKNISINARGREKIVFNAIDFPELIINNPKLWWPHTMGEPYLHKAVFTYKKGEQISDKKEVKFGIRTVSKYFTDNGALGFKVNGQKILIRGGGWVDKLLLEDTKESIEAQLDYVKDMNMNTVRLEGFWGKDHGMYDLCDEKGILIMVGWSCQWEWSHYLGIPTDEKYGGILSEYNMKLMSGAFKDQIVWLRNHPSIISWVAGSDLIPKPELEQMYFDIFEEYDSTRVFLASAKNATTLNGPTGVKMEGPYAYVPPMYWYSDTTKGGAYGFNTETGPGAQVPPLQSLKKMISEDQLWPINKTWDYHCGRFEFGNLNRYLRAMTNRYGTPQSFDDFLNKSQLLNYELIRPMFEAFSAYRSKSATGVIQWMLNSAWPEMYWQLYDYYLMPNGAYYGAKMAQRPYHIIYDYHQKSLFAANDRLEDNNDCILKVSVYNINSEIKYEKEISLDLKANSSSEILSLKDLNVPNMYFIDTRLYDTSGKEIDNNFYWISQKDDLLDYDDTSEAWYVTTHSKQYSDFTALNTMPKISIDSKMTVEKGAEFTSFNVILENKSDQIAFFIYTAVNDSQTGETILPVLWSDNYVSLLPRETRELTAKIKNTEFRNRKAKLVVDGYNLK